MTVQEVKHTLKQWFDRDHRWMSVPVAVATVLVLLVLIKSCQGIVYLQTNECRIYQLGYPIEEARALVAVLSEEQANSFIAGKEYQIACFTTVPYTDIGEYKRYKTRKDTIITERKDSPSKALRTLYDWENRFFAKLDKNSTLPEKSKSSRGNRTGTSQRKSKAGNSSSDIDKTNEKKIRNCLYAHRAGVISIPLLKKDINEFFFALNCSNLCKHRFSKDNYKNYLKRDRWPLAIQKAVDKIESDSLAEFLKEQAPIYSYLLNLKAVSHE